MYLELLRDFLIGRPTRSMMEGGAMKSPEMPRQLSSALFARITLRASKSNLKNLGALAWWG